MMSAWHTPTAPLAAPARLSFLSTSSFPLKADGDAGRNGGVEAQRYDRELMTTSAFFGEDLPVR